MVQHIILDSLEVMAPLSELSLDFGLKNMDFHFIGKTKATQNSDPVVAATMFGLMGTMLVAASTDPDTIYEMKIDHRDGRFIAVRKASHREL